jgi:hypothetical protein
MIYRNTEMKLDQIVNYFNQEKINLSPAFQRGHVWTVGYRRKLIKNIVQGKPIPAIFLYKEESGSRYSYNILDGKQRLESLILFIGDRRQDLQIANWAKYFYTKKDKKHVDFWIELPSGKKTFSELDEKALREFQEYAIPTIEISLNDDTTLDEIIDLFVDINQQGVPVNRFDIVKAMGKNDPLLQHVFRLLAREERRGQDVFYKAKHNEFTGVLNKMKVIDNLADPNAKVDRMWERVLEIVLFFRAKKHRKPVEILKGFISNQESRKEGAPPRFSKSEEGRLRAVFRFLRNGYRTPALAQSRLATDQTHFYIIVRAGGKEQRFCRFDEPQPHRRGRGKKLYRSLYMR